MVTINLSDSWILVRICFRRLIRIITTSHLFIITPIEES
jgi:hypothetical protein